MSSTSSPVPASSQLITWGSFTIPANTTYSYAYNFAVDGNFYTATPVVTPGASGTLTVQNGYYASSSYNAPWFSITNTGSVPLTYNILILEVSPSSGSLSAELTLKKLD